MVVDRRDSRRDSGFGILLLWGGIESNQIGEPGFESRIPNPGEQART
jgi:hypothetical protein